MKRIVTLLTILIVILSLDTQAQTKRRKARKKSISMTTNTVKGGGTVQAAPRSQNKSATVSTPQPAVTGNEYYKTALGLKFLYGISFTAKHFISNKGALEAVIQYRHHSGIGSEFNFTGLYEYHRQIAGASGLRWYAGGGAYVGYFSFDDNAWNNGSSDVSVGAAGTVGLEYKIKGAPLAISVDWQPVYIFNRNSGLATDNGGVGIKYTF